MSSFGPVNRQNPRFGQCLYCADENHTRLHGFYFESRVRMVGPVCKHRLLAAKRLSKQFQVNEMYRQMRRREDCDYWYLRALLPDHCGEPGELVPGTPGNRLRIEGRKPSNKIKDTK